jgi:hypothetical protein
LNCGRWARHDFQPKITLAEGNVWGTRYGKCTFLKCYGKMFEGKRFNAIDNCISNVLYSGLEVDNETTWKPRAVGASPHESHGIA